MAIKNQKKEVPLLIFAELNQSQYQKVSSGSHVIEVPHGVIIESRASKRWLKFECENEDLSKMMTNALDADGINWRYD